MAYITACVKAISILSASFLCQPYITHLLVTSLFVLNDVIVENIVGLCTCTCSSTYKKAMVYYSSCGMYEEYCTNFDNVVSCIKTLSRCRVPCVSVSPFLSYINLNVPIV